MHKDVHAGGHERVGARDGFAGILPLWDELRRGVDG